MALTMARIREKHRCRIILHDVYQELRSLALSKEPIPNILKHERQWALGDLKFTNPIDVNDLRKNERKIDTFRKKYFVQFDWDELKAQWYIANGLEAQLRNNELNLTTLLRLQMETPQVIIALEEKLFCSIKHNYYGSPMTGNSTIMIENYRRNFYTRQCLAHKNHIDGSELLAALKYNHHDIAEAIVDSGISQNKYYLERLIFGYFRRGLVPPERLLRALNLPELIEMDYIDMYLQFADKYREDDQHHALQKLYAELSKSGSFDRLNQVSLRMNTIGIQVDFDRIMVNIIHDADNIKTFLIFERARGGTNLNIIRKLISCCGFTRPKIFRYLFRKYLNMMGDHRWTFDEHLYQEFFNNLKCDYLSKEFEGMLMVHDLFILHNKRFAYAKISEFLFRSTLSQTISEEKINNSLVCDRLFVHLDRLHNLAASNGCFLDYSRLFKYAVWSKNTFFCNWMLEKARNNGCWIEVKSSLQFFAHRYQDQLSFDWYREIVTSTQNLLSFDNIIDIIRAIIVGEMWVITPSEILVAVLELLESIGCNFKYSSYFDKLAILTEARQSYLLVALKWFARKSIESKQSIDYMKIINNTDLDNVGVVKIWARTQLQVGPEMIM